MGEDTDTVGNSSDGASQASQEGSQQSPDLATIARRLESVEKNLKGYQKGADKVNARVESRIGEILASGQLGRIVELAKAGKSSDEIERDLLLEDMLAERKGNASGASNVGNDRRPGGVSEVNPILRQTADEFGLDPNDKDVAEVLSKGNYAGLVKLIVEKSKVPSPDPSTSPILAPKQPAPNAAAEIERGYREEIAKIPRGNAHGVSQVKAKWRQKARDAGLTLNV